MDVNDDYVLDIIQKEKIDILIHGHTHRPGIHNLYVRDKKGCGIAVIEVSVIGYKKFFTPNGDGDNDLWIIRDKLNLISNVKIYDRYGKLLFVINQSVAAWDGRYNGTMMPCSDYWYLLTLKNGQELRGHFSLVL